MENNIREFKRKLKELTAVVDNLNLTGDQAKEIRRSIYVLNLLLNDEKSIVSPYGPGTPIVRQSLN